MSFLDTFGLRFENEKAKEARLEREKRRKEKIKDWEKRQENASKALKDLVQKIENAKDNLEIARELGAEKEIRLAELKLQRLLERLGEVEEKIKKARTMSGTTFVESLQKFWKKLTGFKTFELMENGQKLQDNLDDIKRRAGW